MPLDNLRIKLKYVANNSSDRTSIILSDISDFIWFDVQITPHGYRNLIPMITSTNENNFKYVCVGISDNTVDAIIINNGSNRFSISNPSSKNLLICGYWLISTNN